MSATPSDLRERAQQLTDYERSAIRRVQRMEALVEAIRKLEVEYGDISWGKSQVGIKLFEASMHGERELKLGMNWLQGVKNKAYFARKEAGMES